MGRMMTAVAVLGLCGAGLAQDGGGGKGGEGGKPAPKAASLGFTQIDANGDGAISKAEWLAFFAKLDANKDGSISADESAGNAPEGGSKKKQGDGGGKKGGEGR